MHSNCVRNVRNNCISLCVFIHCFFSPLNLKAPLNGIFRWQRNVTIWKNITSLSYVWLYIRLLDWYYPCLPDKSFLTVHLRWSVISLWLDVLQELFSFLFSHCCWFIFKTWYIWNLCLVVTFSRFSWRYANCSIEHDFLQWINYLLTLSSKQRLLCHDDISNSIVARRIHKIMTLDPVNLF